MLPCVDQVAKDEQVDGKGDLTREKPEVTRQRIPSQEPRSCTVILLIDLLNVATERVPAG